jgi:hypothetical protein
LDRDLDVSGNEKIGGSLDVTGAATLDGGINADSGKFTVADDTGSVHTSGSLDIDGDTEIGGILDITGAANLNGGINADNGKFTVADDTGSVHTSGDLNVSGKTQLGGTLDVTGTATMQNALSVAGQSNLNGGINADNGKFTVADDTGSVHTSGDLDIDGNANVDGNLDINGAMNLNGDLDVDTENINLESTQATNLKTGTSVINMQPSSISMSSDSISLKSNTWEILQDGTLKIGGGYDSGGITIDSNGNIRTVGDLLYSGKTYTINTLETNGSLDVSYTFRSGTNDDDYLQIDTEGTISDNGGRVIIEDNDGIDLNAGTGGISLKGDTAINGALGVQNDAMFFANLALDNGVFTVEDGTGNVNTSGNLDVEGNTGIGGTLDVTGAAILQDTLSLTGAANLNGGINADNGAFTVEDATGNVHTSGDLDVSGKTQVGGTFDVTGKTILSNDLDVQGKTVLGDGTGDDSLIINTGTGTTTITGDTAINGNLHVAGNTTLDNINIQGVTLSQGNAEFTGTVTAAAFIGDGSGLTNVRTAFVGLTTATTNGNIAYSGSKGYEAANKICDNEIEGSHMCQTDEILTTIAYKDYKSLFITGTNAWIAEGPPGFIASANDCEGWTTQTNTKLGPFWDFDQNGGGMGWLTNCAQTKPIACCK